MATLSKDSTSVLEPIATRSSSAGGEQRKGPARANPRGANGVRPVDGYGQEAGITAVTLTLSTANHQSQAAFWKLKRTLKAELA